MPPERTLTDADIAALTAVMQSSHCSCPFTDDEVSAVRDLLTLLKETRSNVIKGIVSVIIGGFFVALAMGIKVWAKQ